MEPLDGPGEESPAGWVDPDDRLWRHPSEMATAAPHRAPVPSRRRSSIASAPWAVSALAGTIGALLTFGIIAAAGGLTTRVQSVRSIERVPASPVHTDVTLISVVDVAERIRPAIVEIDVVGPAGQKASGSGFAFRTDGYILTNRHVVDGASRVQITVANGRTMDARVVGTDPDTDIAVLKVDATMPVAILGSVAGLRVGQQAIAIGSPLGLTGGPSVTVGVVSALGRAIDGDGGGPALVDMIQTDAPIAPGSSGGALVDSAGNVIGITTAIALPSAGTGGLGFATPIDVARDVADQLVRTGKVIHVWLGVSGEDLDPATARTMGVDSGAIVHDVMAHSPAADAGLRRQDVIVLVEGKPVHTMADVVLAVRNRKVGDTLRVTVRRGGQNQTVPVVLRERAA